LKAIGYRADTAVANCTEITADDSSQLQLASDEPALSQDRHDVAQVAVSIRDEHDNFVPAANNRVDFQLTGPARLLGLENGNPTDVTPNKLSHRDAMAGLLKAYIQPTSEAGDIEFAALSALGNLRFQNSTPIAISFTTLNLRGPGQTPKIELHYTLDNSDPTATSPIYQAPFSIDKTTTIKVLALRDGKSFLTTASTFEQGPPITWEDSRFEHPAATTAPSTFPTSPLDKEIVGTWSEGKRQFRFDPDGTVYRQISGGKQEKIARWWYDFPNDPNENPNDAGRGGICFNNSGDVIELRLADQTAKELLIKSKPRDRQFEKVTAP
jgi:beta-galactosidase